MGEGLKDAESKKISSLGGYPEVIHLSSPAHTETSEKETPILTSLPLLPFSLPPTLFVLGCLTRYPSTNQCTALLQLARSAASTSPKGHNLFLLFQSGSLKQIFY